ncbi:MAG TPA: Ig-like domain-containing protein [Pyrinomonadaceae bacterium]|nr:Ig-like domain-containing protein [Pyrinomonadaceae bacterium]
MFPRWKNFTRLGARGPLRLLLAVAFVCVIQLRAEAAGTFISAPSRVDMVYDSGRDTLYITSGASVLRYHLGTDSFLTPFNLGGSLSGLDLSPDGDTLVVADRTRTASNTWIHVVDLRTGAASKALFPRAFQEGGTFTVAYGADARVLVTSTVEGSGWVPLRRLDPATGAWLDLKSHFPAGSFGDIRQDTMLAASGDRSVIGFAEANSSSGPLGRYRVSDSNIIQRSGYTYGTSWYNYEIGVNKDGTQYAVPTYGGTYIYDANVLKTATVLGTYAGPQPVGVVYHPVEDIVYFPWTETTEVRAFDTNTFAQVAAYDFEDTFRSNGNWAFRQGRMKMSRDGSLLFATVTGGVRFLRLYAPLAAEGRSVETLENTPVNVTLAGNVGNGGALSFRVATPPAHGTLSGSGANLVYTPEANYEGPDSFTFVSVYGPAESAPATVSVNVLDGDDAPTADELSVSVDEDASVPVTLAGTDPEGSAVTFAVVAGPAYGTLSGDAPNLVYTPAANFYGSDSFTFSVSDGVASSVGHVYVTVNGVNDAPTAEGQSLATDEDTPLSVALAGADIDSSPLSFIISAPPQHGTLSGTMPNLVYTPHADYSGADSFGFRTSDGAADSSDATVNINVRAVNDAPTATQQSVETDEDTPASITLSGSDPDGDALSYTVVNAPTHGTLSGTGADVVYTPDPNYHGTDNFTFRVSDGTASSGWRYVSISVASVNDAPKSMSQNLGTVEDSAFSFNLYGSDADHDPLTFAVVSQPAHGRLTGTAPSLTYTPDPNYHGTDSFSYKVNDGTADSAVATMSVSVMAVNDAPVANPQTVNVNEDASVAVTLTAADVEGDQLHYWLVNAPQHGGFVGGVIPNLVYRANPNYNGPDSFTFYVYDGNKQSATVTVNINVAAVNDAPVANPQTVATNEDTAKAVTLTGSDVDGDPLTYILVNPPTRGSLTGTVPNLVYTPAANSDGTDSFTFVVYDGKAQSSTATVTVNVAAVNDAPTAVADSLTVYRNSSAVNVTVLSNDHDVDGDALTITSVKAGLNGSVSIAPGGKSVYYTPKRNYRGGDSFTYTVGDGRGSTATASVTVTIK